MLSGGRGRRRTMRAGTWPRGSHYSPFPASHRQCQTAPRSSESPSLAAAPAPATCSTERGTGMWSPGTPWSLVTPAAVTSPTRWTPRRGCIARDYRSRRPPSRRWSAHARAGGCSSRGRRRTAKLSSPGARASRSSGRPSSISTPHASTSVQLALSLSLCTRGTSCCGARWLLRL